MKKTFIFFLLIAIFSATYSSTTSIPVSPSESSVKATEVYVPVGKTGQFISLMELSQINVKDYEALTGKKMKFFDKVNFKIGQRELKKSINHDGTFSKKRIEKYFNKATEGGGGFHIGGFALGFLLGLIGVLIAYLINDDKKKERVKWSWIGCLVLVVILLLSSL